MNERRLIAAQAEAAAAAAAAAKTKADSRSRDSGAACLHNSETDALYVLVVGRVAAKSVHGVDAIVREHIVEALN